MLEKRKKVLGVCPERIGGCLRLGGDYYLHLPNHNIGTPSIVSIVVQVLVEQCKLSICENGWGSLRRFLRCEGYR